MERRDVLRRCRPARWQRQAPASSARPAPRRSRRRPPPATPPAPRGLPVIRIKDVQTILTAPNRIRLVVVKIVTDQPGLHGWGCATFTQRALVVQTAIDQYLKPFLIGRRVDEIEDIWQSSYVSSYWRNGGVLFNAMSGVDMALWDILGKRAGLPLYQLLGGKVRHGADCYYHASGRDFQEVEDNARKGIELGFRYVRVQGGVPGLATYGAARAGAAAGPADVPAEPIGPTAPRDVWESAPYVRMLPKLFEHLRTKLGDGDPAAARRARARPAERSDQPVQGARAVQPVLPRGSVPARGQRLVPAAAPAHQHPDRDG